MPNAMKEPSGPSLPFEPRLLRFAVDGRPCYAVKWSDELAENRREVNYTIREAGANVILCLLANCPLRIAGTPDLVSVTFTGQEFIRPDIEWKHAVLVWEGGETDDEGLVRLCSPDVFQGRGKYLRQDLTRMVREYQHGTRKCHTMTPAPAAMPGQGLADVGWIEKRLNVLAAAVQRSKTDVPIPAQRGEERSRAQRGIRRCTIHARKPRRRNPPRAATLRRVRPSGMWGKAVTGTELCLEGAQS